MPDFRRSEKVVRLVRQTSLSGYVPTLEELIDARVARILALSINDMTDGSPVRMGISVALRESPAYGSRFKTIMRYEGANIKT
jgi:hypothetical protein